MLRFLIAALVIHLSTPQAVITAPVFVEALVKWAQLTPAQAGYVQAAESLGKAVACAISLGLALLCVLPALRWQRRQIRIA